MKYEGKREELKKIGASAAEAAEAHTSQTQYDVRHIGLNKPFPSEGLSHELDRERVFRKTVEVIERPYLTVDSTFPKPKQRRKSPILNKCEDLMQILWEDGYRNEMPWHTLKEYVIAICGGFRTTITDYLGKRAKFYKGRGRSGVLKTPAKPGYLERFGFIQKKTPKLISLNHERVKRSYHYEQSNIINFSLSNFQREQQKEREDTTFIVYDKNNNNTKRERETNCLHENVKESTLTPEELRVLGVSKEGS